MKNQGIKTYVITLSKVFPSTHKRAGEPTGFREKFRVGKLHTIRANYTLWAKRVAEIQKGKAQLAVRQWAGRPYHSKQENVAVLTAADGVGVQKLTFDFDEIDSPRIENVGTEPTSRDIAKNDGLSYEDWREWFKDYDLSKPLAIIHFTNYRY